MGGAERVSGEKWGYLQTYTGLHFYPADPQPDQICMEDIATALSRESRFAGHTNEFYSVAQHSVMVSDIVVALPAYKLWGLLHDASEAYLKDLPWPVKTLCPEYKVMERRLMRIIVGKYGLSWPQPRAVGRADLIALATERRDLLGHLGPHQGHYAPLPAPILPWTPKEARHHFLCQFNKLTRGLK